MVSSHNPLNSCAIDNFVVRPPWPLHLTLVFPTPLNLVFFRSPLMPYNKTWNVLLHPLSVVCLSMPVSTPSSTHMPTRLSGRAGVCICCAHCVSRVRTAPCTTQGLNPCVLSAGITTGTLHAPVWFSNPVSWPTKWDPMSTSQGCCKQ